MISFIIRVKEKRDSCSYLSLSDYLNIVAKKMIICSEIVTENVLFFKSKLKLMKSPPLLICYKKDLLQQVLFLWILCENFLITFTIIIYFT